MRVSSYLSFTRFSHGWFSFHLTFDKHPTGFPPLPRAGKFVDLPRSLSAAQFPFVRPQTAHTEILEYVVHLTVLCGQDSDVFCRLEAHTNNSFFPSRYGCHTTNQSTLLLWLAFISFCLCVMMADDEVHDRFLRGARHRSPR